MMRKYQVRFGGGRRKRGRKATAPTAHPTCGVLPITILSPHVPMVTCVKPPVARYACSLPDLSMEPSTMRHTIVIGLILFVSGSAVGAETPIPQDTVRIEKRRRERLEWNRRTLQGGIRQGRQEGPPLGRAGPQGDGTGRSDVQRGSRPRGHTLEISMSRPRPPSTPVAMTRSWSISTTDPWSGRTIPAEGGNPSDEGLGHRPSGPAVIPPSVARSPSKWPATPRCSAKAPGEEARTEAERDFDAPRLARRAAPRDR